MKKCLDIYFLLESSFFMAGKYCWATTSARSQFDLKCEEQSDPSVLKFLERLLWTNKTWRALQKHSCSLFICNISKNRTSSRQNNVYSGTDLIPRLNMNDNDATGYVIHKILIPQSDDVPHPARVEFLNGTERSSPTFAIIHELYLTFKL